MNRFAISIRTGLVAILVIGTMAVLSLPSANAAVSCDSGFGAKAPVLLVHGENADPRTMDSLRQGIAARVSTAQVVRPFDYSGVSNEWVTNPKIGQALAETIDCLAQASARNGGAGKVVVVGHSMGGLAIREALSKTISGRKVADASGLVVTMGAPHEGSIQANLCIAVGIRPSNCTGPAAKAMAVGSKELKVLPRFPPAVPVRTIAGHVTIVTNIIFSTIKQDLEGDKVVSVKSATALRTNTGSGDGVRIYDCQGEDAKPNGDASCEHGQLVSTSYVQDGVIEGIRGYVTSLSAASLAPNLPSNWQPVPKFKTDARTAFVDTSQCGDDPTICPGFAVVNTRIATTEVPFGDKARRQGACYWDGLHEQDGFYGEPRQVGTLLIGGKEAKHFVQELCGAPTPPRVLGDTLHTWLVEEEDVVIIETEIASPNPTIGLEKILQEATWK